MAPSIVSPAPGTPYFNFTSRLQAFYSARGMWIDGKPQGALTAMLGPAAPFGAPNGIVFFVSAEQIAMLQRDIAENGFRGMSGHGLAQAQRRLREALVRSGAQPSIAQTPVRHQTESVTVVTVTNPFTPLAIPTGGKARKAFEDHAMSCLRAVVDFSQQADYAQLS